MKTPEQIRDMAFQKGPMGGYKQSDVELKAVNAAAEIARKKSAEPEPQKKERYIEGNLFEF